MSSSSLRCSRQTWFHRKVVAPVLALITIGATPRRIAWSLAVGIALGLNPLLGSTTIVSLAAAGLFRLNLVASQITTHLVYPLQLVAFFLFIRLGDRLFHTRRLPLRHRALVEAATHHPWETSRLLWSWEWHAIIVWSLFAALITPALALLLTPILERAAATPATSRP